MWWLPIPGFEGYAVDEFSRVRSLPRTIIKSNGTPYPVRDRILKAPLNARGYPYVNLHVGDKAVAIPVHRLSMLAFVGPPPEGMEVCHNDGIKTNTHLNNLRYDTSSSNQFDKVEHGGHHNKIKTHCPANHPYTEDNTYIDAKGKRGCIICRRVASARHRKKKITTSNRKG